MTEAPPDHGMFDERMGPFTDQPALDALAVRMFRQFSRFEYALKASGKLERADGDAKPGWDSFAREIHEGFELQRATSPPLAEAVDYLMNSPPKKQVARAGTLQWVDAPAGNGCTTERLLVHVRRVRNNLFHGGKFSETWPDPERSGKLIRASLVVLEACLQHSDRVRTAYET